MSGNDAVIVAEVVRSGLVESRHHGSVVALGSDGAVAFALGATEQPMFPRSANKPVQAAAMVRLGLPLEGELLALAAASHSGERFHQQGTLRILAEFDLDESMLQNTPGWPIDQLAMVDHIRRGGEPTSVAADCSGKHAAMLVTCVVNGWSTDDYLDEGHPLQKSIRTTLGELAGEPVDHSGVDGCGAPLFGLTLHGLARVFRSMALAEVGSAEHKVVDAIRKHPEWTSGTTRSEARLIKAVPGLFGKAGAEAVYAVALGDGRAVALKIDDGSVRARPRVMAAALRRLGLDAPVLDDLMTAPVLGGGRPVGEIRPVLPG
jgi:L-asparaginase II